MQDVNRRYLVFDGQLKGSMHNVDNIVKGCPCKWCTNSSQPDIETLARISKLLGVGVEELFNKKFMESV